MDGLGGDLHSKLVGNLACFREAGGDYGEAKAPTTNHPVVSQLPLAVKYLSIIFIVNLILNYYITLNI